MGHLWGGAFVELAGQRHRLAHIPARCLNPLSRSLNFDFLYPESIMHLFKPHLSLLANSKCVSHFPSWLYRLIDPFLSSKTPKPVLGTASCKVLNSSRDWQPSKALRLQAGGRAGWLAPPGEAFATLVDGGAEEKVGLSGEVSPMHRLLASDPFSHKPQTQP